MTLDKRLFVRWSIAEKAIPRLRAGEDAYKIAKEFGVSTEALVRTCSRIRAQRAKRDGKPQRTILEESLERLWRHRPELLDAKSRTATGAPHVSPPASPRPAPPSAPQPSDTSDATASGQRSPRAE